MRTWSSITPFTLQSKQTSDGRANLNRKVGRQKLWNYAAASTPQDSRLVANNLYAQPDEGGPGVHTGGGPSREVTQQLPICRYAQRTRKVRSIHNGTGRATSSGLRKGKRKSRFRVWCLPRVVTLTSVVTLIVKTIMTSMCGVLRMSQGSALDLREAQKHH